MKVLSLRSLMVAEELSAIRNEIELINPINDDTVKCVLAQVGFDTTRGISYEASYHRDLQGVAAVGFQVIGEYSLDPKYRHLLDTMDRVVVAGLTDVSLAKEMSLLMGKKYIYRNDEDDGPNLGVEDDPRYYSAAQLLALGYTGEKDAEEEYAEGPIEGSDIISNQIKVLTELCEQIRGKQ